MFKSVISLFYKTNSTQPTGIAVTNTITTITATDYDYFYSSHAFKTSNIDNLTVSKSSKTLETKANDDPFLPIESQPQNLRETGLIHKIAHHSFTKHLIPLSSIHVNFNKSFQVKHHQNDVSSNYTLTKVNSKLLFYNQRMMSNFLTGSNNVAPNFITDINLNTKVSEDPAVKNVQENSQSEIRKIAEEIIKFDEISDDIKLSFTALTKEGDTNATITPFYTIPDEGSSNLIRGNSMLVNKKRKDRSFGKYLSIHSSLPNTNIFKSSENDSNNPTLKRTFSIRKSSIFKTTATDEIKKPDEDESLFRNKLFNNLKRPRALNNSLKRLCKSKQPQQSDQVIETA
ncbi:3886_t:CDS:2 [Funneliformis mosseae]|uniref:3886_t:CDS:1 n=1 Tax=Funneliformis mosseae TaxID=27381 RepID=A0A9N9GUI3_FUNMO|nr:3886_t:CDS:2 [Funneliformis mosseae]